MDKFGYNYVLEVGTDTGGILQIEPPFTIAFDIIRNTLTSANVCQVRIYNLSVNNRSKLRFNASNYGEFRMIRLSAGFGQRIKTIFTGNISQAWSVREGVDMVTTIECYDGGFAFQNGVVSRTYPAETDQKEIYRDLIGTLPHVEVGKIGEFGGTLSRANSYMGITADVLYDISGGAFFVDAGKGNVLGTNEYFSNGGPITKISAETGLLGTPVLEQSIVHVDMLFEPGLEPGTLVLLDSITERSFNNNVDGLYKITGVKHRGMISESVASSVVTTGEFFFSKLLTEVS